MPEANKVEHPSERYDRNDSYTVIALEDVIDVIEANNEGTIQARFGNTTTFVDLSETDQYEIVEQEDAILFLDQEFDMVSKEIQNGDNSRILVRDGAIVPAVDLEEGDAK